MIPLTIIQDICTWWRKRRFYRVCPEMREIDRKERAARAKHKPCKVYAKQRKALVTELLRGRHG